jgi:phospholipid/cholesterol/gamma-HCH transport system ATP-binding protein
MTVDQNLSFILERHTKLSKAERKDQVMETLEWVRLPEKGSSFPSELSGGQKKRIALARAIVLKPSILLYDEPTTGLDPLSVRTVSELIVQLRDERGITSVAITHDLLCAEIVADTAHFIHEGVIAVSGSLADLRKSPEPVIHTFFQEER